MRRSNVAEGGSNTTVVTAGNSGGASCDAFDTVTGSPTFSSTQAAHGTLSYSFSTSTASTLSLNWTTSLGTPSAIQGRAYLYSTSFTVAVMVCRGRDGSANQIFRIVTDTSGHIVLRVGVGNTLVGTGANAMSVNTWYRVEWSINVGASASVAVNVYLGDSATLFDSVTSSTANTGTSNFAEMDMGIFTSTASVPQFYLDDIVVTDAGLPGPALISGAATPAGVGALTAAVTQGAGTSPAGAGALTAAVVESVTAAPAAAGSLSGSVVQGATGSLGGAGALSAPVVQGSAASPAGVGVVSALVTQRATATPAGAGVLAALAAQQATVALMGASGLASAAVQGVGAVLAGAGAVTADALGMASGTAALAGAGSLSATGTVTGGSCTTSRPFTGTTSRPSAGLTIRPDTGVTEDPC